MSLPEHILEIVKDHRGIKASEIARELMTECKEVNRYLYGELRGKCEQDENYNWYATTKSNNDSHSKDCQMEIQMEELRFNKILNQARKELLDMTLRNPLLNYKIKKSSGIKVVEERSEDIFNLLINNTKKMYFLYDEITEELESDDLLDNIHIENSSNEDKYTDNNLQTPHGEKELYKRLLRTHSYSKTYLEERGVNTLFITLGHLKWFEDKNSEKALYSPLVLMPITLERGSIKNKFSIVSLDKDYSHNYCLQEKLKESFGIDLLSIDSSDEDFNIIEYLNKINDLIVGYNNWEVIIDNITIDCFSFNKFFMFKDLDPEKWKDETSGLLTIKTLLFNEENFVQSEESISDDIFIDDIFQVSDSYHVLDIDSSQTLAVSDAVNKNHLVIQGPPGTGKSQTIVNIIAQAIGENKRILFVSEKLAALDVVKRRLTKVGLGDACLELHSQKANKRTIIEEIKRVLEQDKPIFREHEASSLFLDIVRRRDELNLYCKTVNKKVLNSDILVHDLYGKTLSIQRCFAEKELRIPSVEMPKDAVNWDADTHKDLMDNIMRMERILESIGIPSKHLFFGTNIVFISTRETRLLKEKLEELLINYKKLNLTLQKLNKNLEISIAENYDDIEYQLLITDALINIPQIFECDIENKIWYDCKSIKDLLNNLTKNAAEFVKNQQRYKDAIVDEAWNQDVFKYRTAMAASLNKPFAFLSKTYKEANTYCMGLLLEQEKLTKQEKLNIFDAILQYKKTKQIMEENNDILSSLFGALWQNEKSDFSNMIIIVEWLENLYMVCKKEDINLIIQKVKEGIDKNILLEIVKNTVLYRSNIKTLTLDIFKSIEYDKNEEFYNEAIIIQESKINQWLNNTEKINGIVNYNNERDNLTRNKLGSFEKFAEGWEFGSSLLVHLFNYTWYEMLIDYSHENNSILRMFSREQHEAILNEFREKDLKVMRVNQLRLIKKHDDSLPTNQPAAGEMGILYREMSKKRRHLPMRKLMEVAGEAIQSIKPIMMMSPLSIAAYLNNNRITFDIVIFDEASQMKSVDAFGALLRGKKSVVVGDSQQLPPTNFFNALDMKDENEEELLTNDVESILQLYEAKTAPRRTLRWHYRSKDPSLIAVSNKEFYNNKLWVIPSPNKNSSDFGVKFHHITDSVYDGGKNSSRSNKIEAMCVAKEAMKFAEKFPELTLGIAALSTAQAEAIRDSLEFLRSNDSSTEGYFYKNPEEPFFIKPLENVQGDERDVIFISIGYGKNKDGKLSQNFGPVNKQGGERRLNVLFTRARMRCEVFSSITDEDIRTNESSPKGLQVMKSLLCFARTGNMMETVGKILDFDSPFEEEVYHAITQMGYEADTQVGQSGFFIDIAIIDPKQRGKYLLGIECDGASYHSSRSARDRDRLRQFLLEDKGWMVHRIWSTDWFSNQNSEIVRLRKAIENAITSSNEISKKKKLKNTNEDLEVERLPREEVNLLKKTVYKKANFSGIYNLSTYAEYIKRIVNIESPIHIESVINRIRENANYSRTGSKIRAGINNDLAYLVRQGEVRRKNNFLYTLLFQEIIPRDRSNLEQIERKLDFVPEEEIRVALKKVVKTCFGVTLEELLALSYDLLGYSRVTNTMKTSAMKIIDSLINNKTITKENNNYYMQSGYQNRT